jgi:hypothetical protein
MRKSKTHFEQIPVEEAKKNAEEEVSKQKQSGTEGVIVDRSCQDNRSPTGVTRNRIRKRFRLEERVNDLKYPDWQIPFRDALLEFDKNKLKERLTEVEMAIFNRQQALSRSSDSREERQAIEDALATLRVLKRDSLGFPDWEKSGT